MGALVLHVITTTDRRGAEVFGVDLSHALARRGRAVETVALAPGVQAAPLDVAPLGRRRLAPGTLRALRSRARAAALVIAHGSTTLPACAIATAGTGVPFIYRNIGDPEQWAATRARRIRSGILLRRARAVVALTPAVARTLVARYRLASERVRAIPRGIPAERFPPADDAARRQARENFGLPADVPLVVYLGALSPEKNVGLAVDAVATLPGVHLLVAGDGPERASLERQSEAAVTGRVLFTGALDTPRQALAAADVVVLPSHTEGLPGVAIEAGLSGRPVVATDVGWVRDIVVDGSTGLVVPPGSRDALASALRRALDDPGRMGTAARAHCLERYELEVVAAAWDSLIDEVLATPSEGGLA